MNWEMIDQAIANAAALILFGVMFLGAFVFLFIFGAVVILGARAVIRLMGRKLSHLTWNRVVFFLERKALRSAGTK